MWDDPLLTVVILFVSLMATRVTRLADDPASRTLLILRSRLEIARA